MPKKVTPIPPADESQVQDPAITQPDTLPAESAGESTVHSGDDSKDTSAHQTDSQKPEGETDTTGIRNQDAESAGAVPETLGEDAETEHADSDSAEGPDQDPRNSESEDTHQTDSDDSLPLAAASKSPRRKRMPPPENSGDAPQPTESDSEEAQPAAAVEPNGPSPRQSTPRRRKAIVSIDPDNPAATNRDQTRNDLLDLVESQKAKKILTGTVQGVERPEDNLDVCYAVLYHGAFKVIIPAEEFITPPEDFRGHKPIDVLAYLTAKRLGAEVDFVVKGVDPQTHIAGASRLEAMALKRRQYYFASRSSSSPLQLGGTAEARIVSVIRTGIFVDLFGLEVFIPLKELSYQRWLTADSHFQAGQRILVKILELDVQGRENIRVSASVKQAGINPYELAMRRYAIGSLYVGTVSMVDTVGVFVNLDGGIDCLCSHPKRGRPPKGSRVTLRILGMNHEANRIWGVITHMTNH